jgi:inorganic phosphate transporter, PiT family
VSNDVVLALVIVTGLSFDFTNGFHDTANAMATSIATKALGPRAAVALSGVLNLVGAFLSLSVAATIANGLVSTGLVTLAVVFAGLAGAIICSSRRQRSWRALGPRPGRDRRERHADGPAGATRR